MPLMETATALFKVVGIVVLSQTLSKDGHLQAIAPRIAPAPIKQNVQATVAIQATGVTAHATVIAFHRNSYLGGTWKPQPLKAAPGFLYVALDGQQLDVVTGLRSPTSAQSTLGVELTGLPHLNKCCNDAKLRGEFRPPAFKGASAVLNFPLGNARSETCGATNTGDGAISRRRIDTLVSVENDGRVIVRGASQKLELVLDGKAEVYFANIPADALVESQVGSHQDSGHHVVYYAMLERGRCDYLNCFAAAASSCESVFKQGRNARVALPLSLPTTPVPSWEPMAHIDYQCSNSQWP